MTLPPLLHGPRFRRDHGFTFHHASDYLDRDLDGAGRARIEHHARRCPECHELLVTLRRTVDGLHELDAAREPLDGLAADVIARLRAER